MFFEQDKNSNEICEENMEYIFFALVKAMFDLRIHAQKTNSALTRKHI